MLSNELWFDRTYTFSTAWRKCTQFIFLFKKYCFNVNFKYFFIYQLNFIINNLCASHQFIQSRVTKKICNKHVYKNYISLEYFLIKSFIILLSSSNSFCAKLVALVSTIMIFTFSESFSIVFRFHHWKKANKS